MTLALPPELAARLRSEADRRGEPTDALALRLLDQHLPAADRRPAALDLLRAWAVEDGALSEAEVAENAATLRALDADRPADRLLFPDLPPATTPSTRT
jgi:hypothetical protein